MLNQINDFSVSSSYQVKVHDENDGVCIELPCGLKSKKIDKSEVERNFFIKKEMHNDHFVKELWPTEFSFDFDLTIETWKDLVICERRFPFETDGLSKKEAEWAWILINQWIANPVDTKGEFLEMYYETEATFEALGWDLHLNEQSKDVLRNLFGITSPILINYKPSLKILEFYRNIWIPIKNT